MNRFIAMPSLLAVVLTAAPLWAQVSLQNVDPLPSAQILNRHGLQLGWWGQATTQGQRDKIVHVAIDERSVVTLSSSGLLSLFDSETGQKVWVNRVGRMDQASFLPVLNDRLVMLATGLNLYALDRLNGRLLWQIKVPKMPSGGPSADDDQVYIGTHEGSVYAFDLRMILRLYQERLLPEYTQNTQVWRYQAGDKISSPPVSTGRSVLFASRDHSLYAVSARSRGLLFQFETDAPVSAPLVMHKQNLYLASEDFNFYCLNANNGQVRWSFLSAVAIRKSPYVIEGIVDGKREDVVYILPDLGGISAVNARNGREIWPRPQLRAVNFLAANESLLYVKDQLGDTLLLDRQDGSVVGMIPTIPFNVKINNDRTDRLFLAREDGLIVMIREQDRVFPTYHKYPERRPILPELHDPAAEPVAEPVEQPETNGDTSQ
ncbi:MAG: PQQ-binding-like beta-propeller repeat protein [Planctomycetaceae bacterium]|nr:PQQ-binding-like beta-propeller repeat protein [Planctomycetaceae bacterium]